MHCLFCHSSHVRKASYPRPTRFNNKTFRYFECLDCHLVFIDPLPDGSDYDRMYAKSYHNEFYFKDTVPDYSNWQQLLEKFSPVKEILDYGCGDGSLLRFFQQKGYTCIGVEYDTELVKRLRSENSAITFYTTDEFWNEAGGRQFQIIFMGDVLEHIDQPGNFLKKLMTKVNPGGLITGQGPLENNKNLALGVRKLVSRIKSSIKNEAASHVPYHITFSNAKNQQAVFEGSGLVTKYFKVLEAPWPFPDKFSSSPSRSMMHLVARTSIFLSRILPGRMGNRFLYIGQKTK